MFACGNSHGGSISGGGVKPPPVQLPPTLGFNEGSEKPEISTLESPQFRRSQFVGDLSGSYELSMEVPGGIWNYNTTDNPIALAITDALTRRYGNNYRNLPYYYFQPKLDFFVFYIVSPDMPWGVQNPDMELDGKLLNGPTEIPEMNVHDYFVEQSYGRFEPTFSIYKKPFYFDPSKYEGYVPGGWIEPTEVLPELRDILFDDSNYINYPFARPVIMFGGDEAIGGWAEAGALVFRQREGDPRDLIAGHISLSFWPSILEMFETHKASYVWAIEGGVNHEMGHILDWPEFPFDKTAGRTCQSPRGVLS